MSDLDITLQAPLFINKQASGTGFQEGKRKRQVNFLGG
jgi:hypothetical protein